MERPLTEEEHDLLYEYYNSYVPYTKEIEERYGVVKSQVEKLFETDLKNVTNVIQIPLDVMIANNECRPDFIKGKDLTWSITIDNPITCNDMNEMIYAYSHYEDSVIQVMDGSTTKKMIVLISP